jgi:segregation and condensation protein A
MPYQIDLDSFKGPLDLLLHLIQKHEMDIYDIPIAEITAQYLATIEVMKSLNLDLAGEFLVMAATLLHIKSRMLLPRDEEEAAEEAELDPRTELVQRLLEYQRYREAAISLDALPLLGRDIFVSSSLEAEGADDEESEWEPIGLFELVAAFRQLIQDNGEESVLEISRERLSVTDRINQILVSLSERSSLAFGDLLSGVVSRNEVVVTFLAMLELVKMRLARLMQNGRDSSIWLYAVETLDDNYLQQDEPLGYS